MYRYINGFTVVELMIASCVFLIALAGISIVYISGEGLMHAGINQLDAQRRVQTLNERIIRGIRPARSVTIINGGDGIQLVVPLEFDPVEMEPSNEVTMGVYFQDNSFYYDNNVNDGTPPVLISNNIYRGTNSIFSKIGDCVFVNFVLKSQYLYGPNYPIESVLKIKMRNNLS